MELHVQYISAKIQHQNFTSKFQIRVLIFVCDIKVYIWHWSFEFDIQVLNLTLKWKNSAFHIWLSSFKFNLQLLIWTSCMNDLTLNFVSLATVTTDVGMVAEILRRLAEVVQETLSVLCLSSLRNWLSNSKTRLSGSNTSEHRWKLKIKSFNAWSSIQKLQVEFETWKSNVKCRIFPLQCQIQNLDVKFRAWMSNSNLQCQIQNFNVSY